MPNVSKDGQVWPATDLDLNKSPDLPECPITEGMDVDGLAGTSNAALTKGFDTDVKDDSQSLDGGEIDSYPVKPNPIDPRGYPVSGFVREEAFRKESFLPV